MLLEKDRIIIEENETVDEHVTPMKPGDAKLAVTVRQGAHVKGCIVADKVELYPGVAVEGGILAREVTIVYKDSAPYRLVKVGFGLFGLSKIKFEQESSQPELVLIVRGDVISPLASLPNSIIYGNLISEDLRLENSVVLGVVGLIEFVDSGERVHQLSLVKDSIVTGVLSEIPVEVVGRLGLLTPVMYVKSGSYISGDGEIVLLDSAGVFDYFNKISNLLGSETTSLREMISKYMDEHGLIKILPKNLDGLISFAEVEQLPSMWTKRLATLYESLWTIARGSE